MTTVKWIKIVVDIFDDEKVLLIESLPEADAIITIWFKLLCLAGKQNNSGVLMMNDRIAYTEEMLATIFRRPLNTVRLALNTFEAYGMIEIINGIITIPNWNKHQTLDTLEKKRESQRLLMQRRRAEQKKICEANSEANSEANVSHLEEDKNKNKKENKKENIYIRHKYGEHNNVLLSDTDLEKLKAQFPNDWERRIDDLSCYMKSKGATYKDHLETIRNWDRRDRARQQAAQPARPVVDMDELNSLLNKV